MRKKWLHIIDTCILLPYCDTEKSSLRRFARIVTTATNCWDNIQQESSTRLICLHIVWIPIIHRCAYIEVFLAILLACIFHSRRGNTFMPQLWSHYRRQLNTHELFSIVRVATCWRISDRRIFWVNFWLELCRNRKLTRW